MITTNSTANDAGQLTASPVAVPVSTAKPVLPEWGRLPKSGTLCPWTGLTRSKLNELILPCPANDQKPPVRSICLRQRGKIKGVRLKHRGRDEYPPVGKLRCRHGRFFISHRRRSLPFRPGTATRPRFCGRRLKGFSQLFAREPSGLAAFRLLRHGIHGPGSAPSVSKGRGVGR